MIYIILYAIIALLAAIVFTVDAARAGNVTVRDTFLILVFSLVWPLALIAACGMWWETVSLEDVGNRVIWRKKGGAK